MNRAIHLNGRACTGEMACSAASVMPGITSRESCIPMSFGDRDNAPKCVLDKSLASKKSVMLALLRLLGYVRAR